MDATVVVATYGSPEWEELAKTRAILSIPEGIPFVHVHGETLAKARNAGDAQVESQYVVHLDADDELTPDYFDRMAEGTADLRGPALQRVRRGHLRGEPFVPQVWDHENQHPPYCKAECLRYGNWLLIGTVVRTDLVREVGGWEEWEWSEDWCLFARCWMAGGTVEPIPEAIYRGHENFSGRNRKGRMAAIWHHQQIERALWPEEPSTTIQ